MSTDTKNINKMGLCSDHFNSDTDYNCHSRTIKPRLLKTTVPRKFDTNQRFSNFVVALTRNFEVGYGVQFAHMGVYKRVVESLESRGSSASEARIRQLETQLESVTLDLSESRRTIKSLSTRVTFLEGQNKTLTKQLATNMQEKRKMKFDRSRVKKRNRRLTEQLKRKDLRINVLEHNIKGKVVVVVVFISHRLFDYKNIIHMYILL